MKRFKIFRGEGKHKMKNMQTKTDIKAYARLLKNFYGELYTYIMVNCGLILVWLFTGAGSFWPIWPILVWGISLIIKASKLHVINDVFYEKCHLFRDKVLFLKKDWEDQKIAELLKTAQDQGFIAKEEGPAKKVPPKKPAAAKKPVAKKAASVKKAVAKKAVVKKAAPKKAAAKKVAPKKGKA